MRRIIVAMQVSLDGCIEGRHGELDWVETWEDPFDLLPQIDTCILGRRMYPGYAQYWRAILADPEALLPLTGKAASEGEIGYARFASKTPHAVLSRTLEKVDWENTRIVRDMTDIARMKQLPGKDMYAVGGASLVASLMNHGLIDELRLVVHPLVLAGGTSLFKGVTERRQLTLQRAEPLQSGNVKLTYGLPPTDVRG